VGWAPFGFCGPQIGGHDSYTVGFLGFGRIAQATLHRLIPFGIRRCLYATSSRTPPLRSAEEDAHLQAKYNLEELKRVSTEEVAEKSDLVFVMTPGGEATYHLVNEDFLRKMKKTSILVNPARGPIVDSDALVKALKEGWIWGAGVDVVEGEPNVRNDHPLVKEPR
jgi:glyoxylate/hydroxypyruvate reductase